MAKRVQIFRGTAAVVQATVLRVGELMANLTDKSLHLGDGATPGGTELARADLMNVADATASAAGKMTATQVSQLNAIATNASTNVPELPGVLSLSASDIESDVSSPVTTMYWHPRYGNIVYLYNTVTAIWDAFVVSSAISASFSGVASDKVFDVFMYNNGGTPALEFLAWTNNTTRATNLTTQNGIRVKSGDASRRYVGTAYRDSSGTYDSLTKRWLWNYYNRTQKPMYANIGDGSATHDYSTNTWRVFGGVTTPQFSYVVGLGTYGMPFQADAVAFNSTTTPLRAGIAFARLNDLTTIPTGSNRLNSGIYMQQCTNSVGARPGAYGAGGTGQGLHAMWVLQIANTSASSVMTWYCEDTGSTGIVSSARGMFFG